MLSEPQQEQTLEGLKNQNVLPPYLPHKGESILTLLFPIQREDKFC